MACSPEIDNSKSIGSLVEINFMMKCRDQWLDIVIGATALYLGGPAIQHWLAYYRYPYMRCSTLFEGSANRNNTEAIDLDRGGA
jgi:hypothetical protein